MYHWITADVRANRTIQQDRTRRLMRNIEIEIHRGSSTILFRSLSPGWRFCFLLCCWELYIHPTRSNGFRARPDRKEFRMKERSKTRSRTGAHDIANSRNRSRIIVFYPPRLPTNVQFSDSQLEGFIQTRMQSRYRISDRERLHCTVTNAWRRHFDASNTNRPDRESFPLDSHA
jgi:hypothetical protein